jgi:SAM-dependent methyltransferase
VRVLDFGAGRGRLIATIDDMEPTGANEQPIEWLDYVAYDPYPSNAVECQANIERVYGQATGRYFSDLGALRTHCHDGSFDMLLLTNVFHEIPPQEWTKLSRDIELLLKPEGFLLIVEDQRLPHGERAHKYGFLLFDTLEFRKLFSITAQDEAQVRYVVQTERGGRLKAHYFKRELLARMTPETKRLALMELQNNAKREISRIRTQTEHSFKNGKLHALWMNQFANAQLALEEL